jgi:transcriptional regulator with XRE-family HTH domain
LTNPTEAQLMRPGGLARVLRRLRDDAGLTGVALAEKLGHGWTQPRLSKLENGKQLPTEEDIRAIGLALDAPDSMVETLLDLRSQASAISREWRRGRGEGQAAFQRSYDEMVRAATLIRNHENNVVPGLLQTAGYARSQAMQAVHLDDFDPAEVDATVTARMKRQDVLEDTSKRFEFSIDEAALRMAYCPADVMLGQLGKLLDVTRMPPHVRFGIIPFGVDIPFVPQVRFILLDDVGMVEHFAGDVALGGDYTANFHRAMDHLMAESVTGEAARELIVSAMRWISGL